MHVGQDLAHPLLHFQHAAAKCRGQIQIRRSVMTNPKSFQISKTISEMWYPKYWLWKSKTVCPISNIQYKENITSSFISEKAVSEILNSVRICLSDILKTFRICYDALPEYTIRYGSSHAITYFAWKPQSWYLHISFGLECLLCSKQSAALPHKVKTQYLHFRSHAEYFLLSWKIPEVISRRSILFHN